MQFQPSEILALHLDKLRINMKLLAYYNVIIVSHFDFLLTWKTVSNGLNEKLTWFPIMWDAHPFKNFISFDVSSFMCHPKRIFICNRKILLFYHLSSKHRIIALFFFFPSMLSMFSTFSKTITIVLGYQNVTDRSEASRRSVVFLEFQDVFCLS